MVSAKESSLKKGALANVNTKTKLDRRMRKNESERGERKKMKEALETIKDFFGMKQATKYEVLAKLVDEGEYF